MTQPKTKPGDKPDDQHEEIDLNKAENNALDAAWAALENDPEFQKALAASVRKEQAVGGKPSKGTPADKRLSTNKPKPVIKMPPKVPPKKKG
jgi:hypothetical protein